MRVLHLPVAYLPWTVGGREVYCHTLCHDLEDHGVESIVAIHQDPGRKEAVGVHQHEGISVHVLPALKDFSERVTAYSKVYASLPGFSDLLDQMKPDLVHFHDQNGGASLSHMREVKQRGIPTVLTYHTPGQSCVQRALLYEGKHPCDGKVILQRCTACRLVDSGLPRPFARLASMTEWPGVSPSSSSRWQRVLSARLMTRIFKQSLEEFFDLADGVVVGAEWCRAVLLSNGLAEHKLHLIRTAGREPSNDVVGLKYPARQPLRLACMGRCSPVKGFHVLIDAVKMLPEDVPLQIHFLGPYWDDSYGQELLKRIGGDKRFISPRLVANTDLMTTLAEMDAVVVPSIWLETGPLTVFDAFAAGLPVIGSRLGGISEVVREGLNGWLFEAGSGHDLSRKIQGLLAGELQIPAPVNIRNSFPRTMKTVAGHYAKIYSDYVG